MESTPRPFFDIESIARENTSFRRVLDTTARSQLVVMCLRPGEDIGPETHAQDQFVRVEHGLGLITVGNAKYAARDGAAMIIPGGSFHNIENTSTTELLQVRGRACDKKSVLIYSSSVLSLVHAAGTSDRRSGADKTCLAVLLLLLSCFFSL